MPLVIEVRIYYQSNIYVMTLFFILLKIVAFLAVMIIPFIGPKKKKVPRLSGISTLAVDENGYLEHFNGNPKDHQPV
ncbi:MAG: hypothetical protein JWR38_1576 [Mucilaginibacter sp.]|nr:hypothetical protein [Mucilaginibacter sp.]